MSEYYEHNGRAGLYGDVVATCTSCRRPVDIEASEVCSGCEANQQLAAAEKRGAKAERERIVGMLREEAKRWANDSPHIPPVVNAGFNRIASEMTDLADRLEREP